MEVIPSILARALTSVSRNALAKLGGEESNVNVLLGAQVIETDVAKVAEATEQLLTGTMAEADIVRYTVEGASQARMLLKLFPAEAKAAAIPETFICPLSLEIFTDPVIASDGHTYNRPEISTWLKSHKSSPITREHLVGSAGGTYLVPNRALRSALEDWRRTHGYSADLPNVSAPSPRTPRSILNYLRHADPPLPTPAWQGSLVTSTHWTRVEVNGRVQWVPTPRPDAVMATASSN